MRADKNSHRGTVVAGIALALCVAGCVLITDAATRLANELKDGAATLRNSNQERLEIVHKPLSFPEGVHGPYEVVFQQSVDCTKCGSLWVHDLDTTNPDFKPGGGSTSYHRNFVRVPKELSIRKPKGQPVVIVLRKAASAIEVEALR